MKWILYRWFESAHKRSQISQLSYYSNKHHLMVNTFPKSGSTFLFTILVNLTHFKAVELTIGHEKREHELCKERLGKYQRYDYISHQHTKFSADLGKIISDYNLKTILLVRNIFDVIVSFKDNLRNETENNRLDWPQAYFYPEMLEWTDEKIYEFLAEMCLPWYFNFYCSWLNFENKVVVNYSDLISDAPGTIARIADSFGISVSQAEIVDAIKQARGMNTRLNVGIEGRGKQLPNYVKEKVVRYASYYPHVDFSPIGIET